MLICETAGYALGYVLGPVIKNGFGGWYYVYVLETIIAIPIILLSITAEKISDLLVKKEEKDSLFTQIKLLSKNPIYSSFIIGNAGAVFTIGGVGFWGPTIIQDQYNKTETVASLTLGGMTLFCGLVATIVGAKIFDKMIETPKKLLESNQITDLKFNMFRTEKGCKFLFYASILGAACGLIAAFFGPLLGGDISKGPFLFFVIFLFLAVFLLIS